jgi:hypothetical protein
MCLAVAGCGSTTVRTVTERIAPPATQTSPAPTHTITHTIYRSSPSCVQLAHSAARLASIDSKLFTKIAPLPELVKEAAAAGLSQDVTKIRSIGAQTQAINGDIETSSREIHELDESLPSVGC